MWAMFEVFFDTIVICTLTALVILCVGKECDPSLISGLDGASLTSFCFSQVLGQIGGFLVSGSMAAFAFATIIGWYYIGRQMVGYLANRFQMGWLFELLFPVLYLVSVYLGCISKLDLIWLGSDLVNGLMAYPNLLALWILAKQVRFPGFDSIK